MVANVILACCYASFEIITILRKIDQNKANCMCPAQAPQLSVPKTCLLSARLRLRLTL